MRESDLNKQTRTSVCLLDRTKVLFRFPELEQVTLQTAPETEAVFRMLRAPKRDVFQFPDGREVNVDALPAGMIFDVLEIPGKENLSAVLKEEPAVIEVAAASERKSVRERILKLF